MWQAKSSGAVNVRKNDFIESINLRWKNRISARNGVYEIKKLQVPKVRMTLSEWYTRLWQSSKVSEFK